MATTKDTKTNHKNNEIDEKSVESQIVNNANESLIDLPKPVKEILKERQEKEDSNSNNHDTPVYILIRNYLFQKYDFRMNLVACRLESALKGSNKWSELNINDLECELLEKRFRGFKNALNVLMASSQIPRYDPLKHYFETLPAWDESQPDYIGQLASYVLTTDDAFFQHQFKMMLVRVVALALERISFNKQCFTLYGKQNDGKTSFLRFLCPPVLQEYIKDGIDFNGSGKDAKRALAENLFINLDELAQLGKADMNTVKEFITTSQVKLRLPYDRQDTVMRRRASFVGSTNKQEILTDESGNVRWLFFEVLSINHDKGGAGGYSANMDINNVWAQAVSLLRAGYRYTLNDDEIKYSERNNQKYRYQSDEMAMVLEHFTPSTPERGRFLTSTQIVLELTEKSNGRIRLNSINIGRALRALNFDRIKKDTSRNALYGYYLEDSLPIQINVF